jgi:site-specific DNA recombinase
VLTAKEAYRVSSANGHGPEKAVLYARVSTEEQARSGYSLAQQMEALRGYAAREGYEVLEEVVDPGQSGASLERPGMDRVRDLVAVGNVSVVLAQDRDRFAREPAYHYLLRREFEEYGVRMRALNDRGDGSPEGELTDGILDQLAKFERAKTAERTRRGKLRKAREGKIVAGHTPNYGFAFNTARDGYIVNEATMRVVRRIFRMIGVEGGSIYSVTRTLEREGVPAPAGGRWNKTMIRNLILNDLYRPHTYKEIAKLVSPNVVSRLKPEACYGVWWFNRYRVVATYVSEDGPEGRRYRRRNKSKAKDREEWIAVPVPDAGVPRDVVDAARKAIEHNRAPSNAGLRFWQLSGRIVRCAVCGGVMESHTGGRKNGKSYFYYQCRQRYNNGPRDCTNNKSIRAEELEALVWEFVSGLLKHPQRVRQGLEAMIEVEREGMRGDPDREAKSWLERISEADRRRGVFQDMAAEGLISFDELRAKLSAIEETHKTARHELEILSRRRERIEELERDKNALLESYVGMIPEALDVLTPEERYRVYKMLRLRVVLGPDTSPEVIGTFGASVPVCGLETSSRLPSTSRRTRETARS